MPKWSGDIKKTSHSQVCSKISSVHGSRRECQSCDGKREDFRQTSNRTNTEISSAVRPQPECKRPTTTHHNNTIANNM